MTDNYSGDAGPSIEEQTAIYAQQEAPAAPKREMFHALIRFKAPQEGLITVYAEDKFHARRLITSQFVNREGFEIVDVYAASEIKSTEPVSEDVDLAGAVLSPENEANVEEKVS